MEDVKEIAECSICIGLFTDPRMLPCIHTFCLKCLKETSVKAELKPGDLMPCPICKTPFVIPKEGIAGLKKSFFIDRLAQVIRISKLSDKRNLCDICIEDSEEGASEIPAATMFCIQCEKSSCNRCCREHRRHLRHHQLFPLDSPLKEELLKKFVIQCCERHINEELNLFCTNCKTAICAICVAEEHNSHKCSDIQRAADQIRAEINEELQQLKILTSKAFEKTKQLIDEQKKFHASVEDAEGAIVNKGNKQKEMIEKYTESLLDELTSINRQKMKQFDTEREESERHQATVENLISYSDQLISKGSSVEICLNVSDLRMRNDNVQRLLCQCIRKEEVSAEIAFQSSELEGFLRTENIVGILKVKSAMMYEEKAADSNKCYIPVAIRSNSQLNLQVWFDAHLFVKGITKLLNEIYVLTYAPNQILVFEDQKPFRRQKTIKINETRKPENIESSEKLKSLFMFDSVFRCIWKLTPDDNKIIKWLSNVNGLFKISPHMDDQLLIFIKSVSFNRLKIYGSDRKLIRSLQLPPDIVDPFCCVQKPNGEFIICHENEISKSHCRISLLSSDGRQVIRRFTSDDFGYCYSLFLDSENNRLFATDFGRHMVVLFDANSLQLKKVLLTKQEHEIHQPCALFYDSKNKQLFVSNEFPTSYLNIFDLYMARIY